MDMNGFLLTDFYKIGHPFQYPKGTTRVYSNLTARKSRIEGVNEIVFFGLQYFIKEYLINYFNKNFFDKPKDEVMESYKRRVKTSLGADLPTYSHIEAIWDLGYLPIEIKAVPEGSLVPIRVPCLTITNTLPEFYWLTNFFESIMSAIIWGPITSATISHQYRKILDKYAEETGIDPLFVPWQGHDFSFRGMFGFEAVILSGMAHLLSFTGTDSIPAIDALEQYYNADADKELIGGSVAATEHSVMCAGEKDGEVNTFKRLIVEVYPDGIVSIVSDTWDLWKVLTEYMPELKDIIMKRNGKVVIRPDSGDPVDIICGIPFSTGLFDAGKKRISYYNKFKNKYYKVHINYDEYNGDTYDEGEEIVQIPSVKGVIELLWDVFGGTMTSKDYKLLDVHVGAIYGDSITTSRATEICQRLKAKGFASQPVFGIGSYTYQYNTRDTFGMAMKATYVEVCEENETICRNIFKDPVTDDGTKKSAVGLLQVYKDEKGKLALKDQVSWEEEKQGELKTVFKDGNLLIDQSLDEIRKRLNGK